MPTLALVQETTLAVHRFVLFVFVKGSPAVILVLVQSLPCLPSPSGLLGWVVKHLSDDPAEHASDCQQLALVDPSVDEFQAMLAFLPENLEMELHLEWIVNLVVKTIDVAFFQ